MKTKGFTLVELLVVIAILAILATVSVVGYTAYISSTEAKVALAEANDIHGAIEKALVLDKAVVLDANGTKVVCERTTTGFSIRAYVESSDSKLPTVAGVDSALSKKLTFTAAADDAAASLTYTYNSDNVYDVVTNTKK